MFPDTEFNDNPPPASVFVTMPVALNVVNAPVLGVVAPTVPLYPLVALNVPVTAAPAELTASTSVKVPLALITPSVAVDVEAAPTLRRR